MNDLERHVQEEIKEEREEASRRSKIPVSVRSTDPFEAAKMCTNGKVYLLAGLFRCPWSRCGAEYSVVEFMSAQRGHQFFFYCQKCREMALTLRDVFQIGGLNTFPILKFQKAISEQPGKYIRWMNMLRMLREIMEEHQAKTPKYRERTLHPEHEYGRAITMRTSVEADNS